MSYDICMLKKNTKSLEFKQQGFTLIEIIVVVAIIGIIIAFVGIKISRDTDRLASLEAKRFHAIVSEVRDEAIISGRNLALRIDDRQGAYYFLRWQSGWQKVNDDLFKKRTLEPGVGLESYILDQIEVQTEEKQEDEGEEVEVTPPYIFITPDGQISNFKVSFSGSSKVFQLAFNHKGRLLIESNDK